MPHHPLCFTQIPRFFCFNLIAFLFPIAVFSQEMGNKEEAKTLLAQAKSLISDSLEYDSSLEILNRAESLMKGSSDSVLLREIFYHRAICFRRTGKQDQALALLETVESFWLSAYGPGHEKIGDIRTIQAVCYLDKKESEKCASAIDAGLEIYLKTVGEYHYKTGYLWNVKGRWTLLVKGWEEALPDFLKSAKTCAVIPPHLSAFYPFYNLGEYYSSRRNFSEAIKNYTIALNIRERFLPPDHRDIFPVLRALAYSYSEAGEMDKALQAELQAFVVAKKQFGEQSFQYAIVCSALSFYSWSMDKDLNSGAYFAEQAVNVFNNLRQTLSKECGMAYNNLANCEQHLGNINKALLYHTKALDIRIKVFGEKSCDIGETLNNIGMCYTLMGDFKKALTFYLRFLNNRLDYCEKYHPYTGLAYNNIGDCYQKLGNSNLALEYFALSNEIFSSPQVEGHFQCHLPLDNLGWYYFRRQEYASALYYFEKAVLAAQRAYTGKSAYVADLLLSVAKVKTAQKEYESAQVLVDSALQAINFKGSSLGVISQYSLIDAWQQRADILCQQYLAGRQLAVLFEAKEYAKKALDLLFTIAVDFSESLAKSEIMRNNYASYERALWLETELERLTGQLDSLSFTYAERSKALSLYQSMRESAALHFSGIPDSILRRESELRADLTEQDKQRRDKIRAGFLETDTIVLSIGNRLLDLQRQYDALTKFLETHYPDYYRLKYQVETVGVSYLQDSLLRPNQSLLEYFVGDSAIYIFVITHKKFEIREIKIDFPLETWVHELRQGLFGYHIAHKQVPVLPDSVLLQYTDAAYLLYEKLVAPVENLLTKEVVIIPDGLLGYVPFEALLKSKVASPPSSRFHTYKYWDNDHVVSYSYSATLLKEMQQKQHKSTKLEGLLVMAPFSGNQQEHVYSIVNSNETLISNNRDTLSTLFYSREEASAISQLLNGRALLGTTANKSAFLENAGRYRMLHLSTHGKADDKVGEYAWLGFSSPADSLTFDRVFVKDLYNLSLNADLVVLSACETGIGQLKRGEGIISLARAFAYAGAKSIVTSLWSVDDKSTASLMLLFYQNLKTGMTKHEALAKAKKEFRAANKGTNYAHPFFWAGFIPIGDMSKIINR